jgi:hypothetical protein
VRKGSPFNKESAEAKGGKEPEREPGSRPIFNDAITRYTAKAAVKVEGNI